MYIRIIVQQKMVNVCSKKIRTKSSKRARPHHERLHGSGLEIDHGSTPGISSVPRKDSPGGTGPVGG